MYTQTTLGSFITEIANSLNDSGYVWWAQEEIRQTIVEGLRLWGAFSMYWRERGTLNTTANQPFYDLSAAMPTLRTRVQTLDDLVKQIQYALLEMDANGVVEGIAGMGTDMFTIGQVLNAVTRARNQFVLDARLPFSFGTPSPAPSPPLAQLPDTISLIERVAFLDGTTNLYTPLRREDSWSAPGYDPRWSIAPNKPLAYSVIETMPLQVQVIPPPVSSGTLHMVWVATITINTANPNATFDVPDEFVPAIKYHALWEILTTQGTGADMWRAEYCLERYKMIVEAAKMLRSIGQIQRGNLPLRLDTLAAFDAGNPNWQNIAGVPDTAATAFDLVALSKVPNGVYSFNCDVVRSAPIPASDADFIQLGREELAYVADYVRHALSFKLQGEEFSETMKGHDNFLSGATQRNKLLAAKTKYLEPIFGEAKKGEATVPAA